MKLSKLQGIANNAVQIGAWSFPFSTVKPPYDLQVDLITGEITPNTHGDDVESHFQKVSAWFHESLKKEGIPLTSIEKAGIFIGKETGQRCTIVAKGITFSSRP